MCGTDLKFSLMMGNNSMITIFETKNIPCFLMTDVPENTPFLSHFFIRYCSVKKSNFCTCTFIT